MGCEHDENLCCKCKKLSKIEKIVALRSNVNWCLEWLVFLWSQYLPSDCMLEMGVSCVVVTKLQWEISSTQQEGTTSAKKPKVDNAALQLEELPPSHAWHLDVHSDTHMNEKRLVYN